MLDAGDALADFLALYTLHVGQHALFSEVPLGQVVGRQRRRVVGGQRDEVVENPRFTRRVCLEGLDAAIRFLAQVRGVVFGAHQFVALVSRHILALGSPGIEHLLAEVQRPVEGRRVVVHQLGVGDDLADLVHHGTDLAHVRLFRLDPEQVSATLQAGDAVEYAACLAGAVLETVEAIGQAHRTHQLAVLLDDDVAFTHVFGTLYNVRLQEGVVLVCEVARVARHRDFLREASTQ